MDEIQNTPDAEYAVILATVKWVAHADAVEGIEQEASAGVLDCSTVVAMDPAGRVLLLETMGARASNDYWARRHFKNRSYQPPEGLESPTNAVVAPLATLIGDERLVVGSRLGFDLASLGLGISNVMPVDLSTDRVLRTVQHELLHLGGNVPEEVADFNLNRSALSLPLTMACALFRSMEVHLRNETILERDVLRDAYFFPAIWRLLEAKIVEQRRRV